MCNSFYFPLENIQIPDMVVYLHTSYCSHIKLHLVFLGGGLKGVFCGDFPCKPNRIAVHTVTECTRRLQFRSLQTAIIEESISPQCPF